MQTDAALSNLQSELDNPVTLASDLLTPGPPHAEDLPRTLIAAAVCSVRHADRHTELRNITSRLIPAMHDVIHKTGSVVSVSCP